MREHETTAHLLIVGNDTIRDGRISECLRQFDYSVVVVETGHQALSRFRAGAFNLVLLNITLPDMPGWQFLEQLQTHDAEHGIPVLIYATVGELALAEKCIEKGAEDVLLYEAYSPVLLKIKIENALQKRCLREMLAESQQEYATAQKLASDFTQIILPIGIALSKIKNFDRLLEKILRETKAACHADGGTLYLREGDMLKFVIMLNDSLNMAINQEHTNHLLPPPLALHDAETAVPNHKHVATSTALLGLSINIPDMYSIKDFDFSGIKAFDQRHNYRSIASLTVPLKDYDGEVFGVLQLINPTDPQTGEITPFNDYMQQVAEALASLVALVLSNRFLLKRQKELLRFEDELNIGRQIQTSFLPEVLPEFPGWEIAACLWPAREVSGDFYDIFPLNDHQSLCFVIADVCGKGVGAALFTVLIRTLIRAFAEYGRDGKMTLQSAVEATNKYILENHYHTHLFATLFIGILSTSTGRLTYVNSGHPAPILLSSIDKRTRHLLPTGPALGAFLDSEFHMQQLFLEPGELLFAFTDGITEARNPAGELFSKQRLGQLLEAPIVSTAAGLLDYIEEHVKQHIADAAQFDDVAMVAIHRKL